MTRRANGLPAMLAADDQDCASEGEGHGAARLQELYREHSPRLLRQLTRATGCRETARDLVQETFVRMLRAAPGLLATIERPEAYLRRISNNLVRDWGRAGKFAARSKAELELRTEASFDQVAVLEARERLRRIEAAIASLKPKTRDIFIAHRLEGLSYAQIAQVTGLSIKGVEKQMSKAIAKIDRMLDRS